jgi:hypothetical protein
MVKGVLVKQVRFVEEEDGMDAVLAGLSHVGGHSVKDAGSSDRR